MRLGVHVEGWDRLIEWVERGMSAIDNSRSLFRTLGNVIVKDSVEAFTAAEWHGAAWAPLAEATQQSEHPSVSGRLRGGDNVLHPTGQHIMQTIAITQLTDTMVEVGSPNPWSHVHNAGASLMGTAFGNITLPRRQFIGAHPEVIDKLIEAVQHWLGEEVAGNAG